MTSKRGDKRRGEGAMTTQLIAAACIAATLGLAACDSPISEASKKARQEANKAARIAQSAGEARPKQAFTDAFANKDGSEQEKIAKEIAARISADKLNKGEVYKNYFQQKSVAEDLKAAADLLSNTLKMPEFNDPSIKGAVQEQLGDTASQQAHVQMSGLDAKIARLVTLSLGIQDSAAYINGLGIEADVQDKRAQGVNAADAGPIRAKVDEAKVQAAKAQEALTNLENQIAKLSGEAAKIYADTDAAFQTVEGLKGAAAIEAGKKAVEQRKQGDNITAEILNLQPSLAHAKAELATLKIQQQQAEAQAVAATAGAEQGATVAKVAQERAAALRDQAKKLIEGEKGLAGQYKDFSTMAGETQKDVDASVGLATTADKAFENAISQLSLQQKKIAELGLLPGDPLLKAADSKEARAILQLNQAAAKEELGRANLLGYTTEGLQTLVGSAMESALKAAKMPAAAAPAPSARSYAANAAKEFESAARLADEARKGIGGGQNASSPVQWLSLTLKAVALHGVYSANNDGKKLEEAQAAAKAARDLNPFLPINSLAGAAATTPAP